MKHLQIGPTPEQKNTGYEYKCIDVFWSKHGKKKTNIIVIKICNPPPSKKGQVLIRVTILMFFLSFSTFIWWIFWGLQTWEPGLWNHSEELLWWSEGGDFLRISLVNGSVQISYNLGDRTILLETLQKVLLREVLGMWLKQEEMVQKAKIELIHN